MTLHHTATRIESPVGQGAHPTGQPRVVRPAAAEARNIAELIADAFFDLAPSKWLVKEPDMRVPVMRDYFRIAVEHAMTDGIGHVDVLEDRSAAAVWFHHTQDLPEPADYERRRLDACGRWTEYFIYLDGLFEHHHPHHQHHYLAFLGVVPSMQGTGRGAALLQHHHAALDAAGIPAYLEAASEELTPFYHRHGYRAGTAFHLPSGGPGFWPMDREPQPRS
jgi:GNAT superfamily N-acetyltransferase